MSFRLKTVIGIAAIEIALLAILIVSGLYYLKTSNETQLLERARTTAQLVATMMSDAVLATDLATLDALVAQALTNEGVIYVRVRHVSGAVMSKGGAEAALEVDFVEDRSFESTANDNRLDVAHPILAAGNAFGRVEIGLSTTVIEGVLDAASRWMLGIAAVEIGLVGIFGLLLGTILTRQLARLRAGAGKVASGEFGYQLAVRGKDELADTTKSFNRMSAALAEFAKKARKAQRLAEEGREYAETALRDAMNSMPQGVLIVGPTEKVEFANNAYRRSYREVADILTEEPAFADVAPAVAGAVEEDELTGGGQTAEDRARRIRYAEHHRAWKTVLKDGRHIMNAQRRMTDGGVVVVETDVSELYDALDRNRQLELELMESQKREALGTLAGGIAHEINTPIQYVGNNIRFLTDSFAGVVEGLSEHVRGAGRNDAALNTALEKLDWEFLADEIPSALAEAAEGVETVSRIVLSMKDVSYPESDDKTPYDMSKLIETSMTVSRNQWKYCADVECEIAPGLPEVSCYPGELSQVLINLLVNAAHAIEERHGESGGRIRISAGLEDDVVSIAVTDNGAGIEPDNMKRIFDIFFTTKAPGKGTGQGLAICRSIVTKRHGGRLDVESRLGEGTTFKIRLPLRHDGAREAEATEAA